MATIALRTNANGLAMWVGFAALPLVELVELAEFELPAPLLPLPLPLALALPVPDADEDPREELVAVRVAELKVVLREMGMPVEPRPRLAPVPARVPAVPTRMGVVALRGMAVVATIVLLRIAVTESVIAVGVVDGRDEVTTGVTTDVTTDAETDADWLTGTDVEDPEPPLRLNRPE